MNRFLGACMLAAVIAAVMIWSFSHRPSADLPQENKQIVPEAATCPQPFDATSGIEDLRKIPQDLRPFAAAVKEPMSIDEQAHIAQQFHEHYFAPWTSPEPLFKPSKVIEQARQLPDKTWYGENRHSVEPERIQGLLTLADLAHLPSMDRSGIVIKPAFIRVLPTNRPFYEASDDFPFDQLQFSEIKPNEPVRILHTSTDGAWLYIETSYANGWVEPDAVRFADDAVRQRMIDAAQVVIVKDFATIRTEQGDTLPQPKIGALYPLVRDEPDAWVVEAAVAGEGHEAALTTARIAKGDASPHPLPFSNETLTAIGDELLKTPYGWGELYRNRDCSAMTRDFFLAFGIWLPRNSQKQLASGPFIPLANLSSADKEKRICEVGIPFRTLLHQKGHIMLYVGNHEGTPVILHTVWALRYKTNDCPESRLVIGKTVLSTLKAGMELPLSKGTILERLDGMLVLPIPAEEHRDNH